MDIRSLVSQLYDRAAGAGGPQTFPVNIPEVYGEGGGAGSPEDIAMLLDAIKQVQAAGHQLPPDLAALEQAHGGGAAPGIMDAIGGAASGAMDAIGQAGSGAMDAVRGAAPGVMDAIGQAGSGAMDAIGGAASGAMDAVRGAAPGVMDAVRGAAGAVGDAASGAAGAIGDALTPAPPGPMEDPRFSNVLLQTFSMLAYGMPPEEIKNQLLQNGARPDLVGPAIQKALEVMPQR